VLDVILLALKAGFLLLLFIFVWRVLRDAAGDVLRAARVAETQPSAPPEPRPRRTLIPEFTPEERRARRTRRAQERTMHGELVDFGSVIRPRLVVQESPVLAVGTEFPLEGWVTIGRSPVSDIVLDDSYVSSTHARVVPRGQLWYIEDLGSTNGTFVDGREVQEAQLKLDTHVRIGATTFLYEE